MKAIIVENLVRDFNRLRALDGISFCVEAGEIFGFLGPNGAGKTTSLKKYSNGMKQRLLLGLLADSPTTASMWGSLLLLLLIGSALLKLFGGLDLPAALQSALDWLPGAAMLQLFGLSQTGVFPSGLLWMYASALLAAIAAITFLMAWRLRRMEG